MARIALLDVNVLVALFDPDHVHHEIAHDWFADHRAAGWATCPITENGFVRVVSNPRYRPDAERPGAVIDYLRRFCASGQHHFWPAVISLRDDDLFVEDGAFGHRSLTDLYLLGLARKMGGALATFDRAIPVTAVKGLKRDQLAVIAPDAG
ncbi:MAG TPA: TA system VapC family ribonuclease toxin [Vicinamibacterales bacterium]|nr:TA system VapC family ribonuclease toxin [Vicinamibacterales bacterium]